MPKKFIRRFLPDHKSVLENKALSLFGTLLHEPNLWHLNRRSASGAFGIGLFFAFCPIPMQMWLSAAVAIPLRVNLPLSVATVWITNPFTMAPLFYLAYLVGATVLGVQISDFAFEPTFSWLMSSLSTIGPAFFLGCTICGLVAGILGYIGLDWTWRYQVRKSWENRKKRRQKKTAG